MGTSAFDGRPAFSVAVAAHSNSFGVFAMALYSIVATMNNLQQNDGLLSCPLPMTDWAIRLLAICPPSTT